MSLHRLQGMLPPSRIASKIPHLLFALTTHRAAHLPLPPAQAPRRHASTTRRLPPLPPRAPLLTYHSSDNTTPSRPLKPYLWAISLFGATTGLYLCYYISSYTRSSAQSQHIHLEQNGDVFFRWDDPERDYDEEIEFSEKAMFMGRKRRRLLGDTLVEGKVLEVSCGTGRNFEWYDFEGVGKHGRGKVEELLFNDRSAVMLGQAREKWEELQAERRKKGKGGGFDGLVKGVVGDAGVRGVIKRPEGGFDTIVQTMGVCSMQDPVAFLREMNYLVRQPGEGRGKGNPEDQGGRILLLEHGRGYYEWINGLLDRGAVGHAVRYGCWYNKDVGEVVRESELNVGSIRRYHLGTTWEVVLRPNMELLREEEKRNRVMNEQNGAGAVGNVLEKSRSWWPW